MIKFRYRVVGNGCDSKKRVLEGDYEASSSSACYSHACDLAVMDHSICRIISISVICPPSEAFPIEVI